MSDSVEPRLKYIKHGDELIPASLVTRISVKAETFNATLSPQFSKNPDMSFRLLPTGLLKHLAHLSNGSVVVMGGTRRTRRKGVPDE